jgi:hypothetical protein
MPSLGSGITSPMITNSIVRHNDPYMPHIQRPSSQKQLVTHRSRQTGPDLLQSTPLYHRSYHSLSQLPPLSPPPLSPTSRSFVTSSRPTWRDMQRAPTYQPASSLSSADSEDDDDNEPLGLIHNARPISLLSDASEDGDDDLVPIARLSISRNNVHHMSAAEKYKAKVRARLHMDASTAHPTTPLYV